MSSIALNAFLSSDPRAVRQASRLDFALSLLRHNVPERNVRRRVISQYSCSEATAWRTVEAAKDLV
jgi:hypothetical protein